MRNQNLAYQLCPNVNLQVHPLRLHLLVQVRQVIPKKRVAKAAVAATPVVTTVKVVVLLVAVATAAVAVAVQVHQVIQILMSDDT